MLERVWAVQPSASHLNLTLGATVRTGLRLAEVQEQRALPSMPGDAAGHGISELRRRPTVHECGVHEWAAQERAPIGVVDLPRQDRANVVVNARVRRGDRFELRVIDRQYVQVTDSFDGG